MSDAFNDDLSADMRDPEFAAEFERTTDGVRRERYAAAIAAADDMRKDWCYAEADAAMALADEEIRGLAQEIVEMGGDLSARRREGERLIKLNRDLVRDCRATHEDSARLRAELSETRRKLTEANVARRDTELDCARQLRILRSDLRESADALDESAQLLEDALNENERLRAELEESRRISDEWATAHGARSAETSIARDESARLRAELARARQRLVLADEFAKEHSCLTPDYTEGPCHCVHCDPYSIDRDNNRLRAELEESRRKECDALCSDVERDRDEYEATISRVRAVLDEWRAGDVNYPYLAVRDALDGADDASS